MSAPGTAASRCRRAACRAGRFVPLRAILVCLSLVALPGCGINRRYANNEIRQLPHANVSLEYVFRQTAVVRASDSSDGNGRSVPAGDQHVLAVTYPHPSPRFGRYFALVTLREAAGQPQTAADKLAKQLVTNPFRPPDGAGQEREEPGTLRMAINREELEFLLRDLVSDSFFDRGERDGGVDVVVTLGSRTVRKKWDHVESFDQLAARVRNENTKRAQARRSAAEPRASGLDETPLEPEAHNETPEPAGGTDPVKF